MYCIESLSATVSKVSRRLNLAFLLLFCSLSLVQSSVYMPTDYGDDNSMETYIDICALYEDGTATSVLIGGDFNCPVGSRFTNVFNGFISDNCLVAADVHRLQNEFTYCSEVTLCLYHYTAYNLAMNNSSWLDHMLCNDTIDRWACCTS